VNVDDGIGLRSHYRARMPTDSGIQPGSLADILLFPMLWFFSRSLILAGALEKINCGNKIRFVCIRFNLAHLRSRWQRFVWYRNRLDANATLDIQYSTAWLWR